MSFFGKNIKKIRSVKKLSQQAMADLFELKRATLGAYEEGRSEPKIDTIIKVANYFSISIDRLLTKEITVNELLRFKESVTTNRFTASKERIQSIPFISGVVLKDLLKFGVKNQEDFPVLHLPVNKDAWAFEVIDANLLHMGRGIYPVDVVVAENIESVEGVSKDSLLVVLTKDSMLIRLFSNFTDAVIELCSFNPDIPNDFVELEQIVSVWKVTGVFSNNEPKLQSDLEFKIDKLLG